MTPEEAIDHFLSRALSKRWRSRYASILCTKRGKRTFLAGLYHELQDHLDSSKAVSSFPTKAWALPAFAFSESCGFGQREESLRDAFDTVGDGSLITDSTGRYGIYQPEDMVDDIVYIIV